MTFGKFQDPRKEGSKGGLKESDLRSRRLSEMMKKRWEDPQFRIKHLERLRGYNSIRTRATFVEMGKKSRMYENIVAKRIESSYNFLFKPNEICDRVGVKGDKIFFIEIKNRHNKANARSTRNQRLFRSIAKGSFLIEYY